jgi:glycosyltransferase involved in cell wall biosynthesis
MPDDETSVQHVMMTADSLGGVWTYALELASQLARRGVRTTLATMGGPLRQPQRQAAARIPALRVIESAFKLEWMVDPWQEVAAAGDWLLAIERREHPDLVHLNGYAHAVLDWRAPKLVVAHSCVLSWWIAVLGGEAPASYARYRRKVSRGLCAADAVVGPTHAMLRALQENYGAPLAGTVIPNGIDAPRRPVVGKKPFVLTAGRLWDEAKNVRALAQAARHLRWPVYLAGSTKHPDRPRDFVAPREAVQGLGWLEPDDLHRWMARASIFALPARYEPFGLSVLEAALRGCALVLGDIASLRELWQDAALYVHPDDTQGLIDAIERLSGGDALRAKMARAAEQRALSFPAESMGERYLGLYRELVSGRSAGTFPRPVLPPMSSDEGCSTVRRCV